MLSAVWQLLSDGVGYTDLGTDYFSRLDSSKTIQRLLKPLADPGYHLHATSPS